MDGDPLEKMLRLNKDEVKLLASITKRAYQSVLSHIPVDLKTGRDIGVLKTLWVASLSLRLPDPISYVREVPGPGSGRLGRDSYKLVVYDLENQELPWRTISHIAEDFLKECRDQSCPPHFVLLNELAHSFERPRDLASYWSTLANRFETYIVPGTYHSKDEFFGVAPIYGPRSGQAANVLKQNAARRMGEHIRTPDSRELYTYQTDYGNVVVWICLDIYDPGLVLKFLNITNRFSGKGEDRARRKREISLVLIPAYSSDSTKNIEACVQDLSRFSKTAMICANSFTDTADDRLETFGFCGGTPLRQAFVKEYSFAGSQIVCKAVLYEIDLGSLRQSQAENYQDNGIFSSPFSTIINGGPYSFEDVAE
jgi:hypothetical protein